MATPIWRAIGGALQAPIGIASSAIATFTPVLRPAPLPCQLPSKAPTLAAPSTPEQVDAVLSALSERAPVWASMSFSERAALLRASIKTAVQVLIEGGRERDGEESVTGIHRRHRNQSTGCFFSSDLSNFSQPLLKKKKTQIPVSKPAAQAAVDAKGSYGAGVGEEWLGWMPVMWALRLV